MIVFKNDIIMYNNKRKINGLNHPTEKIEKKICFLNLKEINS